MKLVENEVAVVTGGASGNGRAIAIALAEHGAKAVVVADRQEQPREGGQTTNDLLEKLGVAHTFIETDVSSVTGIQRAVEEAERFGGVTVMVNNAGILPTSDALEVTPEEFDLAYEVNVRSVLFGTQFAARSMIHRKVSGSVINLSSVTALRGTGDLPVYTATKGAVQSMTYALAGRLGKHGIRVNTLNPGVIRTLMTTHDLDMTDDATRKSIPLGRFGTPEEVANVAVFLASPLSAYVHGASMLVDGGMTNAEAVP